jgi:hypothetical protein
LLALVPIRANALKPFCYFIAPLTKLMVDLYDAEKATRLGCCL